MDPDADPDPVIFVSDLQDFNKKLFIFLSFFAYFFLKVLLHQFSKIKSHKGAPPSPPPRLSSSKSASAAQCTQH
jgi:hypothetical protein